MSYSVTQPCGNCIKETRCADGYVIRGAVQGIIHSMNADWPGHPGIHLGSGSIVHTCTNFESKDTAVKVADGASTS
jgi:hypothetical protein